MMALGLSFLRGYAPNQRFLPKFVKGFFTALEGALFVIGELASQSLEVRKSAGQTRNDKVCNNQLAKYVIVDAICTSLCRLDKNSPERVDCSGRLVFIFKICLLTQ